MNNKSSGVSLAGVLLIVFITLKLTGLIDWSWLWVLAPFWLPIVLAVIALLFIAGISVMGALSQ